MRKAPVCTGGKRNVILDDLRRYELALLISKIFMQIRAAIQSDMGKVEKLFSLPELAEADGENCSVETLANYIDEKFFLVAEEGNEIIGAMFGERLKGAGLLLWVFAVEESARGKGVGTALLTNFENNMALENRTWIMLYAPAQSPKTIHFYENRGYQKGRLHIEFLKCFNDNTTAGQVIDSIIL